MFFQNAEAADQRSAADYQQSFTSEKCLKQTVMFSSKHDEIADHDSRIDNL
jgi:hypothetical protein